MPPHTLQLGGTSYDLTGLSDEALEQVRGLHMVERELLRAENLKAVLTRAKNGYIADLRQELVKARTGVDLSDLFADDD